MSIKYKSIIQDNLIIEKKGQIRFLLGSRKEIVIKIRKFQNETVLMDDDILKGIYLSSIPSSLFVKIDELCAIYGIKFDKKHNNFYVKVNLDDSYEFTSKVSDLLTLLVGLDTLLITTEGGDFDSFSNDLF